MHATPRLPISRRDVLVLAAGATLAGPIATVTLQHGALAQAESGTERHGISDFGDLKYPADFKHFDYVNPDAPKGGTFSQIGSTRAFNQSFFTFNTLNSFILKGEAALGMELTFATLMARALDEPDAMYGFAARAVRISPDGLTYRFLMHDEARFHDGSRLTAHDVAFSLMILKEKGHPTITQMLRDMAGVEAIDDKTVIVRFAAGRARDVPQFAASLPIFSRAYYTAKSFEDSSLDAPLGSGVYKVGRFEPGRFIEYERVKDWWGATLPVMIGQYNFDAVRFEYYRDRDVAFEGFTGKSYLFREEFTSRIWATRYNFPAIRDGRVKREILPDDTPSSAQGWFINTRREKFKNPKLREALIDAFDFEWTNKNLMYGSYDRTQSPFQNSDLMAKGPPSADELKLLEPFRGKVPDEVFGEPYTPPVTDGSGQDRALLRRAGQLLNEAGYRIKDGKRVGPDGERLTIEFLLEEPTFQPHHMPFIKNLGLLGIDANLRLIDAVQMQSRKNDFDFDIVTERFGFSATPGDSLRDYFTSRSAATKGTKNLSGIADPAIDALIEQAVTAKDRPSLTTACRALDRLVRSGRYWVPHWYKGNHWLAYWDIYSHPAEKPRYARGVLETWWYDRDKAPKLDRPG
ncbi:extracellular solute-binding protein [Afipia sp. P52-10]|uniref:extracellular solute-binding protein n=1 Tax=Afipia sp. P52-10 TaxID=1429916 RepID=UPI0004BB21E6|nr:extracellular solute-binding protein [Afipia sp. P52-10]